MNSLDPIVKIKIKDKEYKLKPTFQALSDIEDELKCGLLFFINTKGINGNITLKEAFIILKNSFYGDKPSNDDLKEAIGEDSIYYIERCVDFLGISFSKETTVKDKKNVENTSDDLKKNLS